MQVLGRLAPPLAARLAERRFFTPHRFERPVREVSLLAEADRLGRAEDGLAGWSWGRGDGPPVLLVHGWEGRAAQLGAFAAPLAAAGQSVIGYDLPAHGDSPGRQTTMVDFAEALLAVQRRHGPLAGVIAHSIGAAATTLAIERGLQAERLVFVAPPTSMIVVVRRFAGALGLSDGVTSRLLGRVRARVGLGFEEVDAAAIATRMTTPLLVIHDRDDREVSWQAGAQLAGAWPGARLVLTEGLGHRRLLRDADVIAEAVEFLGAEAPRLRAAG